MAILDGRHALVTGGGRGIGRAIAASLSRAGAAVTVLGRKEAALRDAVSAGDATGYVLADDITAGGLPVTRRKLLRLIPARSTPCGASSATTPASTSQLRDGTATRFVPGRITFATTATATFSASASSPT